MKRIIPFLIIIVIMVACSQPQTTTERPVPVIVEMTATAVPPTPTAPPQPVVEATDIPLPTPTSVPEAYPVSVDTDETVSEETASSENTTASRAPRITTRNPQGLYLTNRRPQLQLTFNQAMDQESVAQALMVEPAVPLSLSWSDNTLTIQAEEGLLPGTKYHFTITHAAHNTQGIPLRADYTWEHRTWQLVRQLSPPSKHQPRQFTLHFRYPMDQASVNQALVIDPAIEGSLSWNDNSKQVTYTASEYWRPNTTYTVSFSDSILDQNGDDLLPPPPQTFTTGSPILAHEPTHDATIGSTIGITFDRHMDQASVADAFRITPSILGKLTWQDTVLIFTPDRNLEESTEYTVTLADTVVGQDGTPLLDTPYTWSFTTERWASMTTFGAGPNAQVLDAAGRRAVQFAYISSSRANVDLDFRLYRLDPTQFRNRLADDFVGGWRWEGAPINTDGLEVAYSWSSIEYPPTILSEEHIAETVVPADVPPGLYIFDIVSGHVDDQIFLVISHNAIVTKLAEDQLVTWVTNTNDEVVVDVPVWVYAKNGKLLRNGRTNTDGVFRTDLSATDPNPYLVLAGDGSDIVVTGVNGAWHRGLVWYRNTQNRTPDVPNYATYIYTERPIYRPGQTVHYKAILRQDDDAILSTPPANTPVTIQIRDARNNVVQTTQLQTNPFGTIFGQFALADGAMSGDYQVQVIVDGEGQSQPFKVEDYRKPDYDVTLTADKTAVVRGETLTFSLEADYFLGEPVASASVNVNLYQLTEQYYYYTENKEPEYIWHVWNPGAQRGYTDENGRFSFTLDTNTDTYYDSYTDWRTGLSWETWGVEVTLDDGSRQTVSDFVIIKRFNKAESIQLDTEGYFHQPDKSINLTANVRTIANQPVSDRALRLTVTRWNQARGDYETVDTSLQTTDNNGATTFAFIPPQAGSYRVKVTGHDVLGNEIEHQRYFYVSNSQNPYYSANTLKVIADKTTYAPGDTAVLLIESDFSGPALLSLERGTTRREQRIDLTAPLTSVEVQIQADDAPNIYAVVTAWREPELDFEYIYQSIPDSDLYASLVNLRVPVTNKQLNVTITPNKETYRPREEATFTVRVTNQQGVPVSAELSLAMVDEAIFALSDDLSGDIFDAFYYEREHAVWLAHSYQLRRYLYHGGMGGGGGDGFISGNPRSNFPDTAEWFPVLHTDFNGEATVSLTLPDTLTTWRLTAKAATADTQVGEGILNIETKQDIVVRPILPRTLTAGDQVILSAIVHNYSGQAQEITVSIEEQGESKLSLPPQPNQTVLVPASGLRVVGWPVKVLTAGEATVLVHADVASTRWDSVLLPLPIRPLAIPNMTTEIGQFRGTIATSAVMPADALPMSEVRIELSRSIAGSVLEGLEYLTGYPYGCVEQTMSRALPNAVVGRALFQLGISDPTLQADLPTQISASIQRLYGFQHDDGGWGWWFDDDSHDYQTAWVVFGLATIAEAGHEIDDQVIDRGVSWLNRNLDSMDKRTQAYALYSMAAAGQANITATLNLANNITGLDPFSQAGLALALHEAGESEPARDIIKLLAETATVTEGVVYWQADSDDGYYRRKTMASSVRSTALVLSAFSRIQPGHPLEAGMVRWLMSQRRNAGWGTTNETSYAILGLTDHLLATNFAETETDTAYTLFLNGDTIASGSLGRGAPSTVLTIPAADLSADSNDIRISQEGPGQLYYVINTRVYQTQETIAQEGEIVISRRYINPQTDDAVTTLRPGQLVMVELTVQMPRDGSYMIVEDNLPGGLEALNERLNNTSHVAIIPPGGWSHWADYGYNYKEVRGDHVSFFITDLPSGQRTFTYMARATHAGEFVAMPTEAYAMYDLTLWGRSASSSLTVVE